LAAREGKSGDYATTPYPSKLINNHPQPLLIKKGSFVPNLSLFRREL